MYITQMIRRKIYLNKKCFVTKQDSISNLGFNVRLQGTDIKYSLDADLFSSKKQEFPPHLYKLAKRWNEAESPEHLTDFLFYYRKVMGYKYKQVTCGSLKNDGIINRVCSLFSCDRCPSAPEAVVARIYNTINKETFIIRTFFSFLREEGCFHSFIENIKNRECSNKKKREMFNRNSNDWINYAFTWANTPQGRKFWDGIHRKWQRRIGDGSLLLMIDEYDMAQEKIKEEGKDGR